MERAHPDRRASAAPAQDRCAAAADRSHLRDAQVRRNICPPVSAGAKTSASTMPCSSLVPRWGSRSPTSSAFPPISDGTIWVHGLRSMNISRQTQSGGRKSGDRRRSLCAAGPGKLYSCAGKICRGFGSEQSCRGRNRRRSTDHHSRAGAGCGKSSAVSGRKKLRKLV